MRHLHLACALLGLVLVAACRPAPPAAPSPETSRRVEQLESTLRQRDAQISSLTTERDGLQNRIASLEAEKQTQQAGIDELRAAEQTLRGRVEELQGQLRGLADRFAELQRQRDGLLEQQAPAPAAGEEPAPPPGEEPAAPAARAWRPTTFICTDHRDANPIGTTSQRVLGELLNMGAEPMFMLYERYFLRKRGNRYVIDEAALEALVDRMVPRGSRGYVMLDIEGGGGEVTNWLRYSPDRSEYQNAVSVLSEALRIVKRKRPTAQIGMYSSVILATWRGVYGPAWEHCTPQQRHERIAMAKRPKAVHDLCDYISCSIYDSRPRRLDAQTSVIGREHAIAEMQVAKAIAGERPVIVTVRDRFNDFELIDEAEWLDDQITPALELGCSVAWWGGMLHWVRNGEAQQRQPGEFPPTMTRRQMETYLDRLHRQRGTLLINTTRQWGRSPGGRSPR